MLSLARAEDIPALEKIWTACFGDGQAYQDLFFQNRFHPDNTVVWRERGTAVAMAHLMPYTMEDERGERHLCDYVYAVSTLPEFQGKGISSRLLSYAAQTAEKRGACALSLVPAEESLFDFYRKRGYHTEYYVKRMRVTPEEIGAVPALSFAPCEGQELFSLREAYYGATPFFVRWDRQALDYILLESAYVGRRCLSFTGKRQGYLFCEQAGEDSLFIREIGCEQEDFPAVLAGLHARYPGVREFLFRLKADSPLGQGEVLPFGMTMYLPKTKDRAHLPMTQRLFKQETTVPYMGLMMD